jgi:hypothetical protein
MNHLTIQEIARILIYLLKIVFFFQKISIKEFILYIKKS